MKLVLSFILLNALFSSLALADATLQYKAKVVGIADPIVTLSSVKQTCTVNTKGYPEIAYLKNANEFMKVKTHQIPMRSFVACTKNKKEAI